MADPKADAVALVADAIRLHWLEHGVPPRPITASSVLMGDLGLDSIALAVLVINLEERTGCDPFADGFIAFRTVGELAALYAAAKNG